MFYIHWFELAAYRVLPAIQGIVRTHDGLLALASGVTEGHLLTPPFSPRLAERWDGLEIFDYFGADSITDAGIEIALRHPDTGSPMAFINQQWQPAEQPQYQTMEEARSRLPLYFGPVQFYIRLRRSRPSDPSPEFGGLAIGYHSVRSLMDDAILLALPETIRQMNVQLHQQAEFGADRSILVPEGYTASRISNIRVQEVPSQRVQVGTVEGNKIKTPLPVMGGAHLLWEYELPVVGIEYGKTYQPSTEMPIVLTRYVEQETTRQFPMEAVIRCAGDRLRSWKAYESFDARVEIMVLTRSQREANSITDQIRSQLQQRGAIMVPQFGTMIPLSVKHGKDSPPSSLSEIESLGLEATRFHIILYGLVAGRYEREEQLLHGIDIDSQLTK